MGSIGALENGGELRITDTSLLARRTDRPRSNAHLNDVRPAEQQLFHHLSGNDVARHQRVSGKLGSNLLDKFDEEFTVAVGHVQADELQLGNVADDLV